MRIKEDFIARCVFAPSLLPLAPFFSLFLLHITQGPYAFFRLLFLVPTPVSNHLLFAYLSLTSLSSTPLQYVIQLRITSGQFVFILLDSFKCIKIFITIYAFICLMHVSRYTKTCIACLFILGSQVNKRGNDLILSLCMVYLLSRPTLENGRYIE